MRKVMRVTRFVASLCVGLSLILVSSRVGMSQDMLVVGDTLSLHNGGHSFNLREALLANDTFGSDSVQVVLVTAPAHGQLLSTGPDSYTYQAENGFVGQDSFTYSIQTLPLQRLRIDSSASSLDFHTTVQTAIGTDDDTENVPVQGELIVDMGPDAANIDSLQIVSLDVRNLQSTGLRFDYGFPITVGTLRINADAGNISLFAAETGPKVAVSGILNSFIQVDNLIGVNVEADLDGSGVLSSQVPSDTQILATETRLDLSGVTIVQGDNLAVIIPIDSSFEFDLSGNTIHLEINGSLQAPGVFAPRNTSGVATVIIEVGEVTARDKEWSVPSELVMSIYPNPATSTLSVAVTSPVFGFEASELRIVDVLGRVVSQTDLRMSPFIASSVQVDVSRLPSGLYFVVVESSRGRLARSFLRR